MSKTDSQYAETMLESQKAKSCIENQASLHYSNLLLEQQRVKEYLASKGDNHFAMNQLELQKAKSDLATQASQHFSINQLEQQKLGSVISSQLAEAKYEALKTQHTLAEKMMECCCEVKQKVDLIDRDRLRDKLSNEVNDNNLLKQAELGYSPVLNPLLAGQAAGFGYPGVGPYGGAYGGPGYGYGNAPRYQNGPGNGNGDVNIYSYEGDRRGRRRERRSRSRSRSHSGDRGGNHRG